MLRKQIYDRYTKTITIIKTQINKKKDGVQFLVCLPPWGYLMELLEELLEEPMSVTVLEEPMSVTHSKWILQIHTGSSYLQC